MKLRTAIDQKIGSFLHDRRGSLLPIFALSILPVMLLLGSGIDYARLIKADAQVKVTADAAVLAAQQQYSLNNEVDYTAIVTKYVEENLEEGTKPLFLSDVTVDDIDLSDDGEMSVEVSAKVPLHFMAFLGTSETRVSGRSSAKVGGSSIEVALVLDNTGSMQGNKIAALKDAASDLIETIMPENQADKVKIAVVPFADYVNIDKQNRSLPGLDVPEDYAYQPAGESCTTTYPNSTRVCTCQGDWQQSCNDGVCKQVWNNCASQSCTGSLGNPVYTNCKPKAKQNYKFYGCMASRPDSSGTIVESPTNGEPGILSTSDWCKQIAPVQRLTDNKGLVTAALAKMKTQRNTYIPSGLLWGWHAISPNAPFADGVDYTSNAVRKVIVLMTDGANTKSMSKWTGVTVQNHQGEVWGHDGGNATKANTVLSNLCTTIKEKGIMVYTISFDVDTDSSQIKTLLQDCAGNGGQYYNAADETALADAFKKIGLSLLNLRLSK